MEHTVYVIKPDGIPFRLEIRDMIQKAGLRILASRRVCVPLLLLKKLCFLCKGLTFRSLGYLMWKTYIFGIWCEVGILEGEDAVGRFLEIAGKGKNATRSAPGSIRATFGSRSSVFQYRNAIHRAKRHEVHKDLVIVRQILAHGS